MVYKVSVADIGVDLFDKILWRQIKSWRAISHIGPCTPEQQIELLRDLGIQNISGGHYSKQYSLWNTCDAIVEFESEEAYIAFILTWG